MGLPAGAAAEEVGGGDTPALICSSLMPAGRATPAEGGYRLSGRWRYASCCEHCDWALLGAMVATSNGGASAGGGCVLSPEEARGQGPNRRRGARGTRGTGAGGGGGVASGPPAQRSRGDIPLSGPRATA